MKKSFTNLSSPFISFKKNQSRVSGFKTLLSIFNFKIFCLIFIFFIISGTAESNWLPQEKASSIEAKSSITSDAEKNDSLPDGVTQDWLNDLRDENGNSIKPESNNTSDSHQIPDDPEGDAFQRKIFNGEGTNNEFGFSTASAGDVNGDGYDDIIVGARSYNSNTGRVYIYFGGLVLNTVADVVMTGETTNNYFGSSVSSAGDVNGDGYDDIIIGASRYLFSTGRVNIYFGSSSMDNIADVTLISEVSGESFGNSVSSAGDVNGDGYSDVIVGAYSPGRAYVYFGGSSMNNTSDLIMIRDKTINNFGYSVSTAGDVNGDGYSDVIVGAFGYSSEVGSVYLYYGGLFMDNIEDIIMIGEVLGDSFGFQVSSSGDVNGDGYSDVVVGANSYSSNLGRAYLYFGGTSMNNTADVIITGESPNIRFGNSVSSAGDVNGDGYDDIIVGANRYSSYTGRAYIYFGGSSMNNVADATITGETANSNFGFSVSKAGDINGDGYSEIIVGAYGYSSTTGRAYLYDYFMKNEIIPDVNLTGELSNNNFGYSVSSAGDVNDDGFDDIIIGAYAYNSNAGKAYIYFGGTSMDNIADVTMTGGAANNLFGVSVSDAGDVNNDGYSDVIIGERGYYSNTGRAYVYFGGSSMNNIADLILTGETTNNYFGNSVSSAGDVNGDGYSDIIVGAYQYSSYRGRAYIYYGGSSPDNTADVIMTGETTGDAFGYSVSSAGDVNGDGFSDVIAGAYYHSSITGKAYIYLGGASMNNTADVTMTGEATNNIFGWSVSSAGDVNNDGYADVLVGARGNSSNKGRAYIYLGGSSMNNTSDVTLSGETSGDNFGISVSAAGDVNKDGYSDVIIGAYAYSSNTGKAYLYYGGSSMDNTEDFYMTGGAAGNDFGISVSSAGDVNGDNFSDLIVGAQANSSLRGISNIYLASAISVDPPPCTPTWANFLKISDAGNIKDSLKFGTAPKATINIDPCFGETTQPPPPPLGAFDIRLILQNPPENDASKIDIRPDPSNNIFWKVKFQPSGSGYPITFSWNQNAFPSSGLFFLKDEITGTIVNIDMKAQSSYVLTNPGITSLKIEYQINLISNVSVNSGWNILSVPLKATDMKFTNIFPLATSLAYNFNGSGYIAVDSAKVSKGYWLKFGRDTAYRIEGVSLSPKEIPVISGWNMIGPFDENIPVSSIVSVPSGIVTSLYYQYNNGYIPVDILTAGKGYWVKISASGILMKNTSDNFISENTTQSDSLNSFTKFTITDNNGSVSSLYIGSASQISGNYDLPPVPPNGIFDVRFGSDKFVESYGKSNDVKLNSIAYPIKIKAENLNGHKLRLKDNVNGSIVNILIEDESEIELNAELDNLLLIDENLLPDNYSLSQNYPNPFNPTTKIKYQLPVDGNVKIIIFDLLGKEVQTLVNGFEKAGNYELTFNGINLASGIYFYKMQSESFSEIKRMILIK